MSENKVTCAFDTSGFLIIAKGAKICYTMLTGNSKSLILEVEGRLMRRFLSLATWLTVVLLVVASLPLVAVGAQP
jgi:hypothetical protein